MSASPPVARWARSSLPSESPKVDFVRWAWSLWAERDMDRVEATWDPEIEWDLTRFDEAPPGTVARGVPDVMALIAMWMTTWRAYDVFPEEIIDAGGDDVLVLVRRRAREKGTGAAADLLAAQVWTLRGERVRRIRSFSDIEEARREAGLAPG